MASTEAAVAAAPTHTSANQVMIGASTNSAGPSWASHQPASAPAPRPSTAVTAAITAAADHGIYTVIDMHQDAYSSAISTEDPASCVDGARPGKGWDGAPENPHPGDGEVGGQNLPTAPDC